MASTARSAISGFLRLPNEIHLHVFKKCGAFKDALALSATCKYMRDCWGRHQKAILSHIGRNSIIAFDDALIAVRAIAIAERQYQTISLRAAGASVVGAHPPEFIEPSQLGPDEIAPTAENIIQVLDLQHLVDYILYLGHETRGLHILCLLENPRLQPRRPCESSSRSDALPAGAGSGDEMKLKIYSSMYRYFMVSAALAKSYWAPFFADGPTAPRIREIFSSRLPSNSDAALDSEYDTLNRVLLIEDLAYFRQWVCYNKNNASENQLRLEFGALAGYLVEREWGKAVPESSSQSRVEGPKKIAGDRDLKEAGAVQTIMMLISCHELWWCTAERQLNKCADFAYRPPLLNPSIEYQKVPAIFLGILSVMDVYIPRNFRGCTQQPAIEFDPRHVGYSVDGVPLRQVRPLRMLQILYQRDFADNPDRSEDLPFELGFFQHVLQHYFGLRVIFSWGYTNTRYSDYVGQGVAFCDADQFMRDIPGFLCKIEAAAD